MVIETGQFKERLEKKATPPQKSLKTDYGDDGITRERTSASPELSSMETDIPPLFASGYQKLEFESSVEMLALVDADIREGRVTLYPWQVEESEKLCRVAPINSPTPPPPTELHPFKYCLCACNGSGKDLYVISPFSIWFIITKIRARVIITSSSGTQLSRQTERYIRDLANKINQFTESNEVIGQPILKINQRHITCSLTGSEILLFATDEEGKAEGYHPYAMGEMAIIVNEAKSVTPEIFRALKRCTGYNYWLNISTPGEPIGDFYKSFQNWPNKRRVTYFDCPSHQSPEEFEADKKELGEFSHWFRSKWLALFTFIGGKYVVSPEAMERLKEKRAKGVIEEVKIDNKIRIGLDVALSTNGDETVASPFRGNKQEKLLTYRIKDATVLAATLDKDFREKLHIEKSSDSYVINADDGGVGRGVLDILRKMGWRINRVLNNSTARRKADYKNRGAELWYKFSRLVEEGLVILLDDEKLLEQISSRKYKESTAGIDKLQLQDKKEMISEGLPSPDRADATVLALADISVGDLISKYQRAVSAEATKLVGYTSENIGELEDILLGMEQRTSRKAARHSGGSLNYLIRQRTKELRGVSRV
jgi:phage terminase large subunit